MRLRCFVSNKLLCKYENIFLFKEIHLNKLHVYQLRWRQNMHILDEIYLLCKKGFNFFLTPKVCARLRDSLSKILQSTGYLV